MKTLLRRVSSLLSHPLAFAAFLLALCLIAYGPLLTRLGYYWDDFPMNWIGTTMGAAGLERYFSTNRPVWGLIFRVTTPLLGSVPLTWQLFALLLRWVTGLALWGLLRLLWANKTRSRKTFAAWAAALFVIYPGFSQQYISFVYSHFFIILNVFLLSLILMALALRLPPERKGWFLPLTAASLLLGLLNLLAMEYFFLLDLLRPLLIWVVLSDSIPERRKRLGQTLVSWLPYLAVFAGAMYWRSVLFGFQTYQPALMSRLRANPVQAILQLLPVAITDVWKASYGAWAKAFTLPDMLMIGNRNMQRYWMFLAAGGIAAMNFLLFYQPGIPDPDRPHFWKAWRTDRTWAWQPVALGIVALFIAGGPFWLTDLQIGLVFANDRFLLPFMIGASLVVAGLLILLPLPRWVPAALLSLGLAFAIGKQYEYAISYNRDWSVQRSMFWQMVWRMPDLEPGTALLSNELPVIHYTDNSLTAPLNWMYDPKNDPLELEYALFYPTLRKAETLNNFQPDTAIHLNFLAASFDGNTNKMVAFYYQPPGCLRVLDPQIDIYNWMVPVYLRESLKLTSTRPILVQPREGKSALRPPEHIYGEEIAHGWCYYFEKADLARQQGEWQSVAQIGDEAFAGSDYPNDPLERFPFIEGYAHTGNWERAAALSKDSYTVSPEIIRPMICRLWQRIAEETPASAEQAQAYQQVQTEMECENSAK